MLEEVRLLSNLETPTSKLLQIMLVGQPELNDMLDRPDLRQLRQRIVLRHHLRPFDEAELAHYVDERLRLAGYTGQGRLQALGAEAPLRRHRRACPAWSTCSAMARCSRATRAARRRSTAT